MISPHQAPVFNFADPIPKGRLAIQASAGTGKTFTLAGLATRFVAEQGVPISELLIVTFTRAATSELRARVRRQMVDTADLLELTTSNTAKIPDDVDEITAHLLQDHDPRYLVRLRRAISDFDSATITTIHGFATQVLGTLGNLSGIDPDSTLVDDTDKLTEQTCADVIASHAASGTDPEIIPPIGNLTKVTEKILSIPGMILVPDPNDDTIEIRPRTFASMAIESAGLIAQRRESASTMSFDDVLIRLRHAIEGPGASSVIDALRKRFRVALIDEFQDTDPVQWDIFRSLFGLEDSDTSLVLVGDPKQAIYSFRGADISTYLDAVQPERRIETSSESDPEITRRSLAINWRSDGAMIDAIDTLLDGATFGDPSIAFSRVRPSPHNEPLRILDSEGSSIPALSIRLAVGASITRTAKNNAIQKDAVREAIFGNLVDHINYLLAHATIPDTNSPSGRRPVSPTDIAVLVLRRLDAEAIHTRLSDHGIPAVLSRGSSVLDSDAAVHWRWLLNAMARPSDPSRARTFALSWFSGHSIDWVRNATDIQITGLQESLQAWSETLTTQGFAAMLREIRNRTGVTARVLSHPDGDRHITDLDHVAQLLHDAHLSGALSPAALLTSLDSEPDDDSDTEINGDITSRRVESEADAVQIMTVWVSKGLEFPIVCAPTLWDSRNSPSQIVYRDPQTLQRTFDVASGLNGSWDKSPRAWPDKRSTAFRRDIAIAEQSGEGLRLLYVALTRACHHTAIWWTHTNKSDKSALSRVLFGRIGGRIDSDLFDADAIILPPDDRLHQMLQPLVDLAAGNIEVLVHDSDRPILRPWRSSNSTHTASTLELATPAEAPDRHNSRWSFSTIVNRVDYHPDPHDASMADGGAADELGDEQRPSDRSTIMESLSTPMAISPLATLPAGAAFGTLVHEVLEDVDFTSATLHDELADAVHRRSRFGSLDLRPVTPTHATVSDGVRLLVDGLATAIQTPLGPLFESKSLSEISRADRIDEMSFEFLLGQDDGRPNDRQIGQLVRSHLSDSDPLSGWAADLSNGVFNVDLAGHLTGSIDALFRVVGSNGAPRFVVVDYKSNRLHDAQRGLMPGDYSQSGMAAAMSLHHYGLQALLYSVAVHRFLRWRLPNYDPATHLGGVAYLFVRGMSGPNVSTQHGIPDGVFTWDLPPELVVDLSSLLNKGVTP